MAVRRGILDRKYIFEYDVGRWTYGTIQVLRDRENSQLKMCKTVPKAQLRMLNGDSISRLQSLADLQHPHISSVNEVLEDQSNIYVLSDACEGGDVADWLTRIEDSNWLQEQTCAAYVRQVTLAMVHSHAAQVYHHDLRPSNLLLSSKLPDATVKVTGFGLAPVLDPDNGIVQRNGNAYVAPEVLSGSDHLRDGSADIWSIGAIAHTLLVNRAPKESSGKNGWNLAARVRNNEDEGWSERSHLSRDFVMRALMPAGERPTAAKLLQHPWLKGMIPIGGPHLTEKTDVAREARHKTLCYTLAVLLVPVLVPYRDFEQLRIAFQQSDPDHDGLIDKRMAARLLMSRCSISEAVTAAVSIADVGKEDIVDLCGAACADLIAREFFAAGPTGAPLAGPLRATDLAPRMLRRFFEVFGDRRQAAVQCHSIRTKLRTATARDFESFAGVRYDEILGSLPEEKNIDSQELASQLSVNAGRGTPLAGMELEPLRDSSPWSSSLGMDFGGLLASCGMGSKRAESPHSMRLF